MTLVQGRRGVQVSSLVTTLAIVEGQHDGFPAYLALSVDCFNSTLLHLRKASTHPQR